MGEKVVMVNRAPGLTLWGAVVAERMGFDHDAALTLAAVRAVMGEPAAAFEPEELQEVAYGLYKRFRPQIPRAKSGRGRAGVLDLDVIRSLAPGD